MLNIERKKNVLLVHYSQTGQLTAAANAMMKPLQDCDYIEVTSINLMPEKDFTFPWSLLSFLDVFPESVYLDPPALRPIQLSLRDDYDLIIIAYQVWFLSPSLPMTAFLQHPDTAKILRGKPVITLIACRNMWVMAQETMKKLLSDHQARLLDNVALVDQGSSLASFITTPRWILTGRKQAFWGFPPAGLSSQTINQSCRFGEAICSGLLADEEKGEQPMLSGLGAAKTDYGLIQSERIGYRSFRIWGKLIRACGKPGSKARVPILIFYLFFLILMIVTVVPVSLLLRKLLSIIRKRKQREIEQEFEAPSGSGTERMAQFTCQ